MKVNWKKWLRPLLFTLGGGLLGLAYYYFVGCADGMCALTATPLRAMIYMAVVGWLVSGLFERSCEGECNM